MGEGYTGLLEQIDANRWRIPRRAQAGMRVDGIIYANKDLIHGAIADGGANQVANVASLPGILVASMAMPDIHWGYGFPIGGVAATEIAAGGVVSPGGVGYDINCGVRLLRSNLAAADIRPRLKHLVDQLFRDVPVGVGVGGQFEFASQAMHKLLADGARFLLRQGLASQADLDATESNGCVEGADPDAVSKEAFGRGADQCGTLGSGNHFAEVQVVDEVFDEDLAAALGLEEGMVTIMIHSGSRGLGHQVCTDAIHDMRTAPAKYGIVLPDRQLVCAPVESPEGQQYLAAMRAAANFAWANRQLLAIQVRRVLSSFFGQSEESLGLRQVYDVAHNIAKMETHTVQGRQVKVCVHRKGSTRAFPPGHPELAPQFRKTGQPVLIPGDMGRASYVLVGTQGAMDQTFGSTCHGAGRVMSRTAAIHASKGRRIDQELLAQGIFARARGRTGLMEEQPAAYKDVETVVDCVVAAGLSKKVARLKPMGVIKG